ncbi:MAG: Gfo/Idh/MocA family oxidoreductase [bacterium]|nr:Gfo/Idh/MocA family oxidoreductase [bacterium]
MKSKRWNVSLIGCGGMGCAHLEALLAGGRAEVVSVVDKVEARAGECMMKYGAARCGVDYLDEVTGEDVDVVVIATIPSQHHAIAIAALEHGKHVLCEKPISHTLESAQAMAEAAAKGRGKLLVGHQLRYMQPWPEVISKLRDGLIGKPLVMRMIGNQQTFGQTWEAQKRLIADTSPLTDCGVHYIDLMRLIAGCNAVSVYAQGACLDRSLPEGQYNYGLMQVRFADGSAGFYEAGWGPMISDNAWYVKDFFGPQGSYGMVYELDHNTPDNPPRVATYRLQHRALPYPGCAWEETVFEERVLGHEVGKGNSLRSEHDYFFDALENDLDLSEELQASIEALKIVLAADLSIKENRVVFV